MCRIAPPETLWFNRNDEPVEPALTTSAVEECLRYESPANATPRCAHEDIEIGGKRIRKGELVMCMLGAANRDPEAFADPERLDITRDPNPHESFGGGIHYCIGAPLARVEGRVALSKLLARYSSIEVDTAHVTWANRINHSGRAYLTSAILDGRWMVRVSIGAEATERKHLEELWALMRKEAERGA
jgi:cytochrome P450